MGNTSGKPRSRSKNRKQVHWKTADRPAPPGKPQLVSETELTPDVVTIRWTPPRHDGGSPIKGYLVEHRRYGSPHWVRATPLLVPSPELSLSGLEPGWRYQFRVSAENSVGYSLPSELSELLTVTLQRSAIAAPRFTEELLDTIALENDKVEFVVHFLGQPTPKICWFKDGFEIFSSRRIRITNDNEKSVLMIHQCALTDEGELKCTATNRAGHVSTKARLTLEAPPSIRLPRQYEDGLLFELGEAIRLKVSVDGRPTPTVLWMHNGEIIKDNERCKVENTEKYANLKIIGAERSDRGEYQVKAVNKLGTDSSAFLVTVTDKPSAPGRARVVMTLGKSVTLSWTTPQDDGGCKIGNYIVEYYRIGWDVWLKAATCRQLTTTLGDLIEGSEYKFRVKAESPYGISEPSDETNVVFIPDPKRGIVKPPRSRSHSRIIDRQSQDLSIEKPRSHSSTRVGMYSNQSNNPVFSNNSDVPIRPQRTKVKSPTLSPEISPLPVRRKSPMELNTNMFDPASMARELAYGSPDIIDRKNNTHTDMPSNPISNTLPGFEPKRFSATKIEPLFSSEKPNLPKMAVKPTINMNPTLIHNNSKTQTKFERAETQADKMLDQTGDTFIRTFHSKPSVDAAAPQTHDPQSSKLNTVISLEKETISNTKEAKQKYEIDTPKTLREHTSITDSSEFMLLLLPEEEFNLFENSIPPPLSLSAPELGQEPELFTPLRISVSSTELLHEKAMSRFYEESRSESETEVENTRKQSIPKIQINSKDDQFIVGLDRKDSVKRRLSAGAVNPNQKLWDQRRHSLRNAADLPDLTEGQLRKFPPTLEEKRELFRTRQRSESEEKEEEEFKKVRERMAARKEEKPWLQKRKVEICKEEQWDAAEGEGSSDELEDEEEEEITEDSLSDEETETSSSGEKDRRKSEEPPIYRHEEIEDEEETYRPGLMIRRNVSGPPEAFQNLSKPHALPNPNFVPKPILKRRENYEVFPIETAVGKAPIHQRKNSQNSEDVNSGGEMKFFKRSPSPRPQTTDKPSVSGNYQNNPSVTLPRPMSPFGNSPARLQTQKRPNEEIKVVVDHYGDIVRNYGQKIGQQKVYLNANELKAAAEIESEEDLREIERSIENLSRLDDDDIEGDSREILQYPVRRKKSFTEVSSALFETVKNTFTSALAIETQEDPTPTMLEVFPTVQRRGSGQGLQKRRKSSGINRFLEPSSALKKSPSKSPTREENWSHLRAPPTSNMNGRRLSASMRRNSLTPPVPQGRRSSITGTPKPKMCEITTQTSNEENALSTAAQKEITVRTKLKLRSIVDYLTDLAMFIVACWLYLFHNELLAIPVLFIMVYRQLKDEIKNKILRWMGKRKNKRR